MMIGTVPKESIISIGIACISGIVIPVALFIYFKAKRKADAMPFFMGCLVFFVFVMLLESGINAAVFASDVGKTLRDSVVLYAIYGGVMAGLFEEVGRYLALRLVKRRKGLRDVNSLMYGAGHGGFEAMMLLGVSMFGNLTYAAAINSGRLEELTSQLSGESLEQFMNTVNVLITTPSYTYYISIAERIFAVAIHLSLSVLVWFAITRKGKGHLFPLAILIHAAVDFVTALVAGLGVPAVGIEAIVAGMAVAVVFFARTVWRKIKAESPDADDTSDDTSDDGPSYSGIRRLQR
ncbi:MAG: YhfC family intramembrane metalloprotease [Firmicutes bacterium]|nr:YhfC family intramembrane metalloprotease [Bacillota bacterium]